jgi:putative PEP-CTERM system histidine kinase
MSLHQLPLWIGMISGILPVVAMYMRQRSRLLRIAALTGSLAVAVHLAILLRLLQRAPENAVNPLVLALAASPVPILLAGYLISLSVGREFPEEFLRSRRRTFAYLGLAGIACLLGLRSHAFVTGYDWVGRMGTIHLGALGKAYLSYLLIGGVLVGYNLESTYRLAPSHLRHHLRLPFLGFFAILMYYTFVLTTGMLYSSIGLGKLIAAGMPIALANAFIGYGFMRGALTDVAAPVSRHIVYSSFTAMAAGLYVLAVGIVAQVATVTKWSPDEVVSLSFGFLAAFIAILLLFSNRFQRQVRRFIDRNFYVNRYDYRAQWSHVTQALGNAASRSEVLAGAHTLLQEVFLADEITIALRDEASPTIRPRAGKGQGDPAAVLPEDTPLYHRLRQERRAMLLDRRRDDFEQIPIYAENRFWLEHTASHLCAPICDGPELVGVLGLQRRHGDDAFTFEDVTLLDNVAAHVSATLNSVRLAEELAQSREMDLVAQCSNMLLHDLKNYLAPLRMVAQNLVKFKDRPDIASIAAQDVERVATRMEGLILKLSEARTRLHLEGTQLDLDALVRTVLEDMQVAKRPGTQMHLDLQAGLPVVGDEGMLRRVLENVIANALDAMNGSGTLRINSRPRPAQQNGKSQVLLNVADSGCGMSEEFLRDQLFHPFATTKRGGLGLGLYQSRAIIRAHGGEMHVASRLGQGTTVELVLATSAIASHTAGPAQPQVESSWVTP